MYANKRRSRPSGGKDTDRIETTESFNLGNSRIIVVDGPAMAVRIERDGSVEWGYVAAETVAALAEVAE